MNRLALGRSVAGLSPSDDLDAFRQESMSPGDRNVIKEMRESGSQTARERVLALLDDASFVEVDAFVRHRSGDHGMHMHTPLGDGVVAGHGMLDGRRVACFSQDFSVFSGTMGEMHAKKICKVVEFAEKACIPIIGIWDGDGQRAHEGVTSLGPNGDLLDNLVSCSGKVPMISIILGTVSGTSALAAGLSDFVILGKQRGRMFMRSPYVIPEIISGEVDEDTLGGANHHASRSGVACLVSDSERGAFDMAAEILSHMPDHTMSEPPNLASGDKWDRRCKGMGKLVPQDSDMPYDMRSVIKQVFDDKRFMELSPSYAENVVIGFARLDGHAVGVIGNQPSVLAGCLDIDASVKAARFIRTCDCFNIPIVTFVDVPGFLPGTVQEWGGIIRHGAKLLYAYAEATVPKMTVITRKAYGGAYDVMSSKHIRGDYNIAWPTAQLAVMGAEGAVQIIHRKRIATSGNPEQERDRLVEDYDETFANPYRAAALGYLDDVIQPSQTREVLTRALGALLDKEEIRPARKHGNIPL